MNTMQRTLKLKLLIDNAQADILRDTFRHYSACFNEVARVAWGSGVINGVRLHHETYASLRAEHPTLPSQLVISAREKAREAVKSALSRKKKGNKASCPQANGTQAIRYDARSSRLFLNDRKIGLSTTGGRLNLPFAMPEYFRPFLDQATGINSRDLVLYPNGTSWVHLVVTLPDVVVPSTSKVVGVDVGISRIAVSSDGQFFNGKHVKEHSRKLLRLKRRLQAKGTKSAKRHLKKLRRRERRFMADMNHRVSKSLVNALPPGSTIAMENLTDIRERVKARRKQRRELHGWSFFQFQQFVKYKAEARGIRVVFVDARYSSQGCSRCGHVARSNRQSQSWFRCKKCGYQTNADLNASRNLAQRGISALGRLPKSTSLS